MRCVCQAGQRLQSRQMTTDLTVLVGLCWLVSVFPGRKWSGFFGVDAVQEVKCQPSLCACLRGVRVLRACAQSSFMGFGVINATALLVLVVRVLCKTS